MVQWLKKSDSDIPRLERDIERLSDLKDKLHYLAKFAPLSQSGAFKIISELVDEQVVKGMPRVRQLLQDAHIGEHHQKIALDAPQRFSSLIELAEEYTEREISAKIRELDKIKKDIEKD